MRRRSVCSDPDLKVTVDVFGGAGSMTSSVATVFLPADDGDDGVALVEMVEHLTDRPPGSKEEVKGWLRRHDESKSDSGLLLATRPRSTGKGIDVVVGTFEDLSSDDTPYMTMYSSGSVGGYSGCPLVVPANDGGLIIKGVHVGTTGEGTNRVAYAVTGQMRQWIADAVFSEWVDGSKKTPKKQAIIDDQNSSSVRRGEKVKPKPKDGGGGAEDDTQLGGKENDVVVDDDLPGGDEGGADQG